MLMRELGWRTEGLEPDARAVAAGRSVGLEIHEGTLETVELPPERYAWIRLSDVLEHIADPVQALGAVRRLLHDEGRVEITVPNIASWSFHLFRRYWFPLEVPRHLLFYTPASIRLLAQRCGFSIEELRIWSHKEVDVVESTRYWLGERHPRLLGAFDHRPVRTIYRKLFAPWKWLADRCGGGSAMTLTLRKELH